MPGKACTSSTAAFLPHRPPMSFSSCAELSISCVWIRRSFAPVSSVSFVCACQRTFRAAVIGHDRRHGAALCHGEIHGLGGAFAFRGGRGQCAPRCLHRACPPRSTGETRPRRAPPSPGRSRFPVRSGKADAAALPLQTAMQDASASGQRTRLFVHTRTPPPPSWLARAYDR